MKKIFAFVLTLVLVFTATGATTAFAAEVNPYEINSTESTNTTSQRSGVMYGDQAASATMNYIGANASFEFLINGNNNMTVDLLARHSNGTVYTLFTAVRCNNVMQYRNNSGLPAGSYTFIVVKNSGTTTGESKAFYISATW